MKSTNNTGVCLQVVNDDHKLGKKQSYYSKTCNKYRHPRKTANLSEDMVRL